MKGVMAFTRYFGTQSGWSKGNSANTLHYFSFMSYQPASCMFNILSVTRRSGLPQVWAVVCRQGLVCSTEGAASVPSQLKPTMI